MKLKFNQKFKENWLLILFGIVLITGLTSLILTGSEGAYRSSRNEVNTSLSIILIYGVIIAPVLEEITFRGIFIPKKATIISSFALLLFFVILTYKNHYSLLLFFIFTVVFYIYSRTKKSIIFKLLCTLNAMLFGFIHYDITDFHQFETAYFVLFQISIGVFLTWITINFGLLRSMICHSIYNFLALGYMLLTIQFPNTKINKYEDTNVMVVWQRIPYFESFTSNYAPNLETLEADNTTINNFYKVFNIRGNDEKNNNIIPSEPFMKYRFTVRLKNTSNHKKIEDCSHDFFIQEKLIYLKNHID